MANHKNDQIGVAKVSDITTTTSSTQSEQNQTNNSKKYIRIIKDTGFDISDLLLKFRMYKGGLRRHYEINESQLEEDSRVKSVSTLMRSATPFPNSTEKSNKEKKFQKINAVCDEIINLLFKLFILFLKEYFVYFSEDLSDMKTPNSREDAIRIADRLSEVVLKKDKRKITALILFFFLICLILAITIGYLKYNPDVPMKTGVSRIIII